ncbi:MAG TPA: glycoside hydrolase family 3 N-terminal domain-containing protein [Streptosporangiaceae bacterium]|nr:glycoside hydrolase family 3 N-terminal domain-containing protein [Streptosporangiaceae bacterium]
MTRGRNLIVLVTAIVAAIAAIVLFAASAAARHSASTSSRTVTTTTSDTRARQLAREQAAVAAASVGLRPGAVSPSTAGVAAAAATLPKLTTTQLAGQRVIYSYSGLNPPAQLLNLIRHGEVAGVVFFAGNVGSKAHLAAVAAELQKAAAAKTDPVRLPLLLMTDQEGGQVRRLPGEPVLSAKQVGEAAHPWRAATAAGKGAGQNLRGVGLNVNLAPVLDIYRKAGNFIDEFGRSFSSNAGKVAKLGALYAQAEQQQRVAATVKHFPGLGAAATSQNTDERPVTLKLPLSVIRGTDELPYKAAITAKAKVVMVSWAIYPALDAKNPAGLSSVIVQDELRKRLGFAGVTMTDALGAGALGPFGSIAHRATLAARAGMDLLLCSEGKYTEGTAAMNSIAYDYTHHSLNAADFKAAVMRVLALRATLAGK